ncbi:MAG TPA: hypothetical protein VM260_25880 [Pirellula sp.]|nr:hypothetical protein [Pirellula sp.]
MNCQKEYVDTPKRTRRAFVGWLGSIDEAYILDGQSSPDASVAPAAKVVIASRRDRRDSTGL